MIWPFHVEVMTPVGLWSPMGAARRLALAIAMAEVLHNPERVRILVTLGPDAGRVLTLADARCYVDECYATGDA